MRFTNIFLLAVVGVLTLTGVYGLFWVMPGWIWEVHRAAGWALVAAIPWKMAISARSLRRGLRWNVDRGLMVGISLLLAAATLGVLGLGVSWKWRLGPEQYWLRQTAVSWHWMLALGLLVPFALHVWRRWPRPQRADLVSRRAFLKLAGLGAAALVTWKISDALAEQRQEMDAPRRASGSRLDGYYSGNHFPVTHNRAAEEIDPAAWQLTIGGKVAQPLRLGLADVQAQSTDEQSATLDCTLGWYSIQRWQGVPLRRLLDEAGASSQALQVRLESVTGYARFLPLVEAQQVLLATHVGGELLAHLHGAPLRAVVPTRRGWFWVKWLTHIEVI